MRYVTGEFYRDRETFADRLFCSEDTFAVADGMGIGRGARVAAEKAIELVGKYRPFRSLEDIRSFFNKANLEIMEETAKLGDRYVSGTTLSLITFRDNSYLLGHVGDSRIYLWRGGSLELLTEDQIRLKGGKKYVSALGIDWKPEVFLREGDLSKGDVFLVVSDGLGGLLKEKELSDILSGDIEDSAKRLLELYRKYSLKEDLSFAIVTLD